MHLADFLALFEGVVQRNGYYLAKCPAHDDQRQSLSISTGRDATILLKCHAGDTARAVVEAKGLTMSDLFADAPDKRKRAHPPNGPVRAITATYDYEDETGALLYQAVRYIPKDFRQRRPDPERPTEWLWTTKGVRHVLYKLADLAILRPTRVVIVEGEKDADALWAMGIPATTSVAGAGKWSGHDYPAQLIAAGVADIVVCPDNDEPGRAHMREVAESCLAAGLAVHWLDMPVPAKGDVSDWLAAGGTGAALVALLDAARAWPFRTTLTDVHALFLKWFGEDVDLTALDITLAAAASIHLPGDPAWLMLVGGSGVGKTEMVVPLQGAGGVLISSISSPGALLSGTASRERAAGSSGGVLREIGERGLLIVKDFTSMLSMDRTARQGVLAALREVYDGRWVRSVGTDGGRTLTWAGRLVIIAACTTAWDEHQAVIATMGDRFLIVRFDSRYGRAQAFRQARRNTGHETQLRRELHDAVGALLETIDPALVVTLTEAQEEYLYTLANLVTLARTGVETDYRGDVVTDHAPEMPTRFGRQLFQIVVGGVAFGLSIEVSLGLAARCARDSIPPLRLRVLDDLVDHPESRLKDIVGRLNKPRTTLKRTLESLQVLDLVTVTERPTGKTDEDGNPIVSTIYTLQSIVNPLVIKDFHVTGNVGTKEMREPGDEQETSGKVGRADSAPF